MSYVFCNNNVFLIKGSATGGAEMRAERGARGFRKGAYNEVRVAPKALALPKLPQRARGRSPTLCESFSQQRKKLFANTAERSLYEAPPKKKARCQLGIAPFYIKPYSSV